MTLTDSGKLELAQPVLKDLKRSGRWIDTDDGMVMLDGWFTVIELEALISAASFGKSPEDLGSE